MWYARQAHYAQQCRYHDCTHRSEKGCAVLEALDNGDISMAAYENYLKIAKESAFFESTELERKKKDKQLGKLLKHYDKLNVKGKKNEDGGL
ncbi:MAG: putative ribosome biogenesis GTPase RsgA [Bacteroidetes bacterium ADurb.Bin416]|nr:MAG: putative ribosome biogenesis GTPase RsgA [Bacteroidetes bacterium ADurb.Bin416]